jgi:CHASE2 domain-containing sensor protein
MPRVIVLRVARMWDFFRPEQNIVLNGVLEGRGRWQSRLATYEYFPLFALSIGGLVLLRRRRTPILPFLAIALSITITAATSFGITRYRAPVDAMLPVLASGALVWLFAHGWAWLKQQGGATQPAAVAP